eukprot:1899213-Amphidinium_carterae.1
MLIGPSCVAFQLGSFQSLCLHISIVQFLGEQHSVLHCNLTIAQVHSVRMRGTRTPHGLLFCDFLPNCNGQRKGPLKMPSIKEEEQGQKRS